ncbi:GM18231 [Drosophila sechellia]|uniref:GM18231 n=1 Tax=Drosophila sechellia TaxID=7238 RepID=B4I2K1_DROSE|nr:GM18231 [Drosophila sechellia]
MKSCCATQTTRCECPTGLRLGKRPQAPLIDMLGPHPDEIIMTILDRILYLSGATKIIPMLELSKEDKINPAHHQHPVHQAIAVLEAARLILHRPGAPAAPSRRLSVVVPSQRNAAAVQKFH